MTMNEPVLVLNANYEPLNVCTTKRAMGLIFAGKAEMIENGRGYIKTVQDLFPRPSVIRIGYMIKRPRPRVRLSKREVFRRDGYTCQYCGTRTGRLTLDHVVPRHMGGRYAWENLVTACASCNLRKGGRALDQSPMSLNHKPHEPNASALYLFGNHLNDNEGWRRYLEGW
jgi:5-methylcytosine-specific restriction endonuclease McrA